MYCSKLGGRRTTHTTAVLVLGRNDIASLIHRAGLKSVFFRRAWALALSLMARVLAEKGYHYQYVFAKNAKHVDRPTVAQTLPAALEWLWKGYPIP